jgi:hypothetical protein
MRELMAEAMGLPMRITKKSLSSNDDPAGFSGSAQGEGEGVGEAVDCSAPSMAMGARGAAEMPRRIDPAFVRSPGSTCFPHPTLGWYNTLLHGQPAAVNVAQGSEIEYTPVAVVTKSCDALGLSAQSCTR